METEGRVEEESYNPPEEKEVRWMFDYRLLVYELKAKLKGGYVEEDKKTGAIKIKVPKGAKPLMNEEGIEQTIALISAFIDGRIYGLSIYDEDRVMIICRYLMRKLSDFYYVNMEKFDLTPDKATIVISIILNLFESNLRKSLAGMGMRVIGSSERVIVKEGDDKEKRSILPFKR